MSAPGYVCFRARYLQLEKADRNGKHPNALIRPLTTISGSNPDSAWQYFWEVAEFEALPKQQRIAITTLTAEGRSKPFPKGYVPRGPVIVKAPFL